MELGENHIIIKAIEVVSRHGIKKTTMGDIADSAGVSRQTLYNKFANKDEVLRGAIRYTAETGLDELRARWAETDRIDEKLDALFQVGPIGWYDAIMSFPDSADLIEGVYTIAAVELAEGAKLWIAALALQFEPFSEKLSHSGLTPTQFADFVYFAGKTAKDGVEGRDQLLQRLAALKASSLALLGEK